MQRIAVLLNENEYTQFDEYCNEQGHKKSTLIARLIRDFLEREQAVSQPRFLEHGRNGGARAKRAS
jgi:metal-responsive CopG/Arc/MetJ family transcriptional regulator